MKKKLQVIHIDDDTEFIEHFKKIIINEPNIIYQENFTNVETAYHYLQAHTPDIIFMDVEMPDKNGFWLAERLKDIHSDIVFVTSHQGYALNAFEACAVDYLIKPISEKKIHTFLDRYQFRINKNTPLITEQIKEVFTHYLETKEKPVRIFINTAGKIDIVNLKDVLYFSSKENFTEIYMLDKTKHNSGKSIKTYEDAIFRNSDFVRIHRSVIVNRHHVKRILRDSRKHRFAVVMSNNDELEMSYLKKDEILEALIK